MDLEEKESTESGSLAETESPPPVSSEGAVMVLPEVMNMAVSMSMEKSLGAPPAATAVEGGGSGVSVAGGVVGTGSDGKKKRGRPRKYDSEGNLRVQYLMKATPPSSGFTLSPSPTSPHQFSSSSKRGRGRPHGSGNWQLLASLGELFANTAGGDFTPHVMTVYTGEDVAGKILSFVQKGSRGLCVLSANGTISNVTIRQPGSSGGILTYEGRFEILSLTGSFTTSENGGMKSRAGGLSVSLAGPDGRVIGGGVAGLLLAASPIQIVVGSFTPNAYKTHKRKHNPEPRMSTAMHGALNAVTVAKPVSQAPPGINIFPTPTSHVAVETNGEADNSTSNTDNPNSTSIDIADWNGSDPMLEQRSTPDINLSAAFEQP
ncbi:hypothetical protein ACH5RR_005557 [Cinchona calisaya]|uniref:AT-hook motif nuclear-localized protein n=1 Tax=Cinchona calisaya TaxID=153742 RepID=A0ABD3ALH7_9GENT